MPRRAAPRRIPRRTRRRHHVRRTAAKSSAVETSVIVETLRDLVADEPQAGRFYVVQWRDRPGTVFRDALATCGILSPTQGQVDQYAHLVAGGRYNGDLYGSRGTSRTYPSRWLVPGLGMGIRSAFLPRNQDALELWLHGARPMCVVDRDTGAPRSPATSYGMIWLPPCEAVGYDLTGQGYEWPDGSSTLDPPSVFFEADNE